jgi:hypothetical protein
VQDYVPCGVVVSRIKSFFLDAFSSDGLRALLSASLLAAGLAWPVALSADVPYNSLLTPKPGDNWLTILSPNVLELNLINTKDPSPARVTSWDWVTDQGAFSPPSMASVRIVVNGHTNSVTSVGFKRRPIYAPFVERDLRIGNELYLRFAGNIADGDSVQVVNDGTVWPTNLLFAAVADRLRQNPALHVNQEGYMPAYPKKAMVGYYLGNLGELAVPTNKFFLINAVSGATAYQGTLTLRLDTGYTYPVAPYQSVYEADFTAFTTPGQYRLMVPGMGASMPFRIDEGVAMAFARTYALGIFHQRSGFNVAMPFTRFSHAADHIAPSTVPVDGSSPFTFTWSTIASYESEVNTDNPPQTAPHMTNYNAQLYPFVNLGPVAVSGGHFEAGDYNRVTYNGAQIVHSLMFAVDSFPGVAARDNLGIPESSDGISDAMQEAKWEADYLAKVQDTDGGFYYSVYPQYREYEYDVLPENGDPQVVWPKNTSTTAAAVAALAQCASSPLFKQTYPTVASNYLSKAKLGWQFLTNAINLHGLSGAYQKIQHFGDEFTDRDELAWAACELYLATGDPKYQAKLMEWFPDPTDPATFRYATFRMAANYGNVIRDYAFAVRSGRLTSTQIQTNYLVKCLNVITNCAEDTLTWSKDNAYGSSFPLLTKNYRGGGWYFSMEQAFDLVVAYQLNAKPEYLDAILRNLNFEGGCNPVNVPFLTGLGWKRQRNVVDQYSANDRHALPKDGVPFSNINKEFLGTWFYGNELSTLMYPSDYDNNSAYAPYDRWCDDWNVSTEGSTTDTARGFAGAIWLAAQTSLATQPWRSTNATIIPPAAPKIPGAPVTLKLSVADTNLNNARIVWESQNQEPAYGGLAFTFPAGTTEGTYWVEAEVSWPDGRRAFATNSYVLSNLAPPELSGAKKLTNGFSFVLSGAPLTAYTIQVSTNFLSWTPLATNTTPANGQLNVTDSTVSPARARFYRAIKAP